MTKGVTKGDEGDELHLFHLFVHLFTYLGGFTLWGMTNTQRTIRACRELGREVDIVERRVAPCPGRPYGFGRDLFHIIDLICLDPELGIVGVQSCGSDYAGHYKKILAAQHAPMWIEAGGVLELWGWRKVKKVRGSKVMVWRPRRHTFELSDFEGYTGGEPRA